MARTGHGSRTEQRTTLACRCDVLNIMSGEVARGYAQEHLRESRIDGAGRPVMRCERTGLEWVEERTGHGYGEDVTLLRRVAR